MWSCMDENDKRLNDYTGRLIEILPTVGDKQARELLIILQHLDLKEEFEGKLFDICMDIWEKIGKKPSVRYNAFKLIINIVKKHPELYQEIKFLLESQYLDSFSDAARKSIATMVSGLKISEK